VARSWHPLLQLGAVFSKRSSPSLINYEILFDKLRRYECFVSRILCRGNEGGGWTTNVLKELRHIIFLEFVLVHLHARHAFIDMLIIIAFSLGMIRWLLAPLRCISEELTPLFLEVVAPGNFRVYVGELWRVSIRSRVFVLLLKFGYLHSFCLADFFVPEAILAIAICLFTHIPSDLVYCWWRYMGLFSSCYVYVSINFTLHHLSIERLFVWLTSFLLWEVALYTEILCSTLRAELELDHLARIHEMVCATFWEGAVHISAFFNAIKLRILWTGITRFDRTVTCVLSICS